MLHHLHLWYSVVKVMLWLFLSKLRMVSCIHIEWQVRVILSSTGVSNPHKCCFPLTKLQLLQEKFHKLLDIYQKLRGIAVDFISPTRDFVREGPITKISARSGEKQSRFLFLVRMCLDSVVTVKLIVVVDMTWQCRKHEDGCYDFIVWWLLTTDLTWSLSNLKLLILSGSISYLTIFSDIKW